MRRRGIRQAGSWRRLGPALLLGAALLHPASAGATRVAPSSEQAQFFEKQVRPVLLARCTACHGAQRAQGKLRLDTRAGFERGGDSGSLVDSAVPEKSLLLRALSHRDPIIKMPPAGKIPDSEVAALTRWVVAGAPWPGEPAEGGGPSSAGTRPPPDADRHWSFQPLARPRIPAVRNEAWVRNPVDAFILARLEARGLKPAPPADRRTLLRRATFDLTGLPPTPQEVEEFLNDRSPDAWSRVIERLLASPAYGERWGRHWLDVARYSDSNGMDENVHYGNAWRYRDYVVDSLNRDKPLDRFIVEQLAGDLLVRDAPAERRRELLVATGFLSIGPKVISEVDDQKMLMDMIDEQIETVGRTFLGMTFGCARCHDHKFDPVSTRDYYSLAGIFKSTRTMTVMKKPRMWHEHPLASAEEEARKKAYDEQIAALKKRIADHVSQGNAAARKALGPGKPLPKDAESLYPGGVRAELASLRGALAELEKQPVELPAAMGVAEGEVADLKIHIRGSFLNLGEPAPRRFPRVIAAAAGQPGIAPGSSGRLELARWLVSPDNPLAPRVLVNRAWRWHFGRGIVASTDNFGLLGERPTHPELLDWLARWMISPQRPDTRQAAATPVSGGGAAGGGWSLKALHRLLMQSNTYRMSSAHSPAAAAADPANQLWWRAEVRRLEAEEIRDGLLAVSGRLDRTLGGTLIPLKNREYFFDHTSRDTTKYVTTRRSLYLPIVRNHLYEVFQLFDFGDAQIPEGNRPTTTVAPQALFALNSDLMRESAAALAKALPAGATDTARLDRLFRQALGRPVAPAEAAALHRTLALLRGRAPGESDAEKETAAWTWLCHSILASNEFLFLR